MGKFSYVLAKPQGTWATFPTFSCCPFNSLGFGFGFVSDSTFFVCIDSDSYRNEKAGFAQHYSIFTIVVYISVLFIPGYREGCPVLFFAYYRVCSIQFQYTEGFNVGFSVFYFIYG